MTIVVGIPGVQGPPGTGINVRGAWSSTATYAINDCVTYNGSSYTALTASVGAEPDITPLQWSLFVAGALNMIGSNGSHAGAAGLVPAPAADAQGRFLRGDGTWAPGAVSALTYNGSSQLTGYTEDGIAYALTYNGDGTLNTITGGGSVGTCSYTSGVFTGISYT
jgi:YD repeat-containing protein